MRTFLIRVLAFLTITFLAACSSATPSPTPAPTQSVVQSTNVSTLSPITATVAPTATRQVPPVASTLLPTPSQPVPLTFNAPDNAALAAMYYPPIVRPAPGILLLHMYGGSKADWDSFARDLQKQGYAALAIDLRGQGASAGPVDWAKAPDDVKGAWQLLSSRPEVDMNRTAIVGASVGANLALMVGGSQSRVNAVVALSPGLDYFGLNPSSSMRSFGERPVYLVASQDDSNSYSAIQALAPLSVAAEKLEFKAAGHGTAMFQDPTLEPTLISWLNKYVRDLK